MLLLAPEQSSRLQDYCAISVFVKVLMMRGYGFDDTSFPRIAFQKKVRNKPKYTHTHKHKHTHTHINTHTHTKKVLVHPPGGGRLGGLGSGLHAQAEQLAAGGEGGAEEGPDPGDVGSAHRPLRPPARRRPRLHHTPGPRREEEERRRKPHLDTKQDAAGAKAELDLYFKGSGVSHCRSGI